MARLCCVVLVEMAGSLVSSVAIESDGSLTTPMWSLADDGALPCGGSLLELGALNHNG
jgi:hypothetical protein